MLDKMKWAVSWVDPATDKIVETWIISGDTMDQALVDLVSGNPEIVRTDHRNELLLRGWVGKISRAVFR